MGKSTISMAIFNSYDWVSPMLRNTPTDLDDCYPMTSETSEKMERGPELQSDLPKVKVVTTYNWDRMKGQLYI